MIRYNQMCRDLVKFVDYAVPILLGTEQKIISIDSDWSSFFYRAALPSKAKIRISQIRRS